MQLSKMILQKRTWMARGKKKITQRDQKANKEAPSKERAWINLPKWWFWVLRFLMPISVWKIIKACAEPTVGCISYESCWAASNWHGGIVSLFYEFGNLNWHDEIYNIEFPPVSNFHHCLLTCLCRRRPHFRFESESRMHF